MGYSAARSFPAAVLRERGFSGGAYLLAATRLRIRRTLVRSSHGFSLPKNRNGSGARDPTGIAPGARALARARRRGQCRRNDTHGGFFAGAYTSEGHGLDRSPLCGYL